MGRRRFTNTDIPYADRLLMNKYQKIKDQRNDAARIALKVACVALNDSLGLSYVRLCRFAEVFTGLIKEYYQSTDACEVRLNERLRSMGFTVGEDGIVLAYQNPDGKFVQLKDFEAEDHER